MHARMPAMRYDAEDTQAAGEAQHNTEVASRIIVQCRPQSTTEQKNDLLVTCTLCTASLCAIAIESWVLICIEQRNESRSPFFRVVPN